MNNSWLKYEKGVIFRDKSKGGLLSQFLKEYKKQFGGSINPSCRKCLNKYFTNYLNFINMKNEGKCDYVLKAKYNGIQLGVNGRPVRNGEMNNKTGKELMENHPHGVDLFEKYPKPTKKEKSKK